MPNFPTFDELYSTLERQFYLSVPFPVAQEEIDAAVESFFKFLKEPKEIKQLIDFNITETHRRGDVGYKKRDSDDHIYNDNKEFFHFHPMILDRHAALLDSNPALNDFCLRANKMWNAVYQTLDQIFKLFDQSFPGTHSKIFDTKHPHILLRFLRYDWTSSGKYLAKPHYDAGSFTLAISESCPGLRIGSGPDDLKTVEHEKGKAIFMLSSNVVKVIDDPKLLPAWHDVIQVDESKIGKPFARWAVVAFIDAKDVEALPRSETHKWYKPELENI